MVDEESGGARNGSSTITNEREVPESEQRLAQLRPYIAPGHVFALDDEDSGRTAAGKTNRPAVLVRVPPLDERAAIALQQRVQVSNRVSWKREKWGPPPATEGERADLLRRMGWAFSPARTVPGLNKDGIFEVRRLYPVKVVDLINGRPLGWLLPPALAKQVMAYSGVGLPACYPSSDAEGGDA
jgi:hypothetical protein